MAFGLPWSKPGGGSGGGGGGGVTTNFGVYTPEEYGAVGNGIADDLGALQRFEAARLAGNGLGLLRNVYGVSAPLILAGGVRWIGYGTIAGRSRILALAPMAAPVIVQQDSPANPNFFGWLRLDGGRAARDAFLSIGNSGAQFRACEFGNALQNGERTGNGCRPATIGAVTQVGAGPALAVTQLDPAYLELGGAAVVLKCDVPGALETASVKMSTDGGATFSPFGQVMFARSQLGYQSGSAILTGTGLLLTWTGATPFALNATWAFSCTDFPAANNTLQFDHCRYTNCGTVYASAGIIGDYPGPTFNTSLAPGTVSTTAGSQMILGDGATDFLAMGAQDGAAIRVAGLTVTLSDGSVVPQRLQLAAVLDKRHALVTQNATPNQTLAGRDYAFAVGAGFSEDIETGQQGNKLVIQPEVINCAMVARIGALSGMHIINPVYRNWAITAFGVGTDHPD